MLLFSLTGSKIIRHSSCMAKWRLLFMLPRCILASPVQGGHSHYRETLELFRRKAGEFTDVWADVVEDSRWLRKLPRPTVYDFQMPEEQGISQKDSIKRLVRPFSEGEAGASAEVFDQMLSKHPQVAPPSFPQGPPSSPPHIASEIILKAIRSFPVGFVFDPTLSL